MLKVKNLTFEVNEEGKKRNFSRVRTAISYVWRIPEPV